MADNVAMRKIEGVLVPEKMLQYSKNCLPKEMRITALNYYLIFGRQSAETTMELLDKYQNIFCQNFPIDSMGKVLGTDEGEKVVFEQIEKYLSGRVMGAEKRFIFEIFKPMINAYLDPAYVLYTIACRRPQAYLIILNTDGGFEWVRKICLKVRERYGMLSPEIQQYLMQPWEMKAMQVAGKKGD